jgi:hypothetical protein
MHDAADGVNGKVSDFPENPFGGSEDYDTLTNVELQEFPPIEACR